MSISTDPMGKTKSNVVHKKQINAVIQTVKQRIEGKIYVFPNRRVLDEINYTEGFLAVTEARIVDGETSQTAEFVAVNLKHIVWLIEEKR